jgi:hypothetical protein
MRQKMKDGWTKERKEGQGMEIFKSSFLFENIFK